MLDALKKMKAMGVWVEVTTLVVTGVNDDPEELRDIARFLVEELGPETPWHISRYFPAYRMANPATPLATLQRAREIGQEAGLRYIYVGNVPGRKTPTATPATSCSSAVPASGCWRTMSALTGPRPLRDGRGGSGDGGE